MGHLRADLQAGQGALIEVGEEMVGLAKEYTPVDDGTLRASADEVGINEESGTDWAGVSFGFGGAAASYAVAIHEYPDATFSAVTQARRAQMGTGWKFLQRAMEELSDQVEERLAEGISARLESDGNAP